MLRVSSKRRAAGTKEAFIGSAKVRFLQASGSSFACLLANWRCNDVPYLPCLATFGLQVRSLTEDQRSSLSKEVAGLNLSRYVSEIVDAMADNKLKTADISAAVHLCCLMHQR